MKRQTVPFTTEEAWLAARERDLTSTSIAALLGRSPYQTPFELWYEKHKGEKTARFDTEAMEWGNALEPAIAHKLAAKHGWEIRPMKEYIRFPELRLASSFDYLITNLAVPTILECKNVGVRMLNNPDGWVETDFSYEAPSYIEYQAQTQLLLSGFPELIIGACIGGNEERLLHRTLFQDVADEIMDASKKFWASTEPPPPDFYRDGKLLAHLHGYAEPDKVVNATPEIERLVEEYLRFSDEAKIADEHKQARKAELLTLVGDAEKIVGKGFSVSAGMIAPTEVKAYTRAGYRGWRVHKRKPK